MQSLAELDKYIEDQHPDWNCNSDGFIVHIISLYFIDSLLTTTSCWMSLQEESVHKMGRYLVLPANANAIFAQVDENGGCHELFDWLCAYCNKHNVCVD